MSDILTHKTKNNRKRSFGGVRGGRVYERSPRRLWTKQSGEINYLVADTGTAARGRSYCPAETEKNNSPEAKQRITSAKSKITQPLQGCDVSFDSTRPPPPQATYWSHQPWPYSSGGFHLQVVQSCQHSLLPSAPPASHGNPSPVCAKDTPAFDRDPAQAFLLREDLSVYATRAM